MSTNRQHPEANTKQKSNPFTLSSNMSAKPGKCFKCNRYGHWSSECYAKSVVDDDGDMSERRSQNCSSCGRPGHDASRCNAKTGVKQDICHRCGRPGHWESECYAKSIVNNEGTYVVKGTHAATGEAMTYVGTSVDIGRRIDQHRTGEGAKVTQEMRGGRRVLPVTRNHHESSAGYTNETLETVAQMRRQGSGQVRGGPLCQREFTDREERIARVMLEKEQGDRSDYQRGKRNR
jgi:predicted GIY-YIG superfamily endonuclease